MAPGCRIRPILELCQTIGTWSMAAPYVSGDFLWIEEMPSDAARSIQARLDDLQRLRDAGTITEAERQDGRARILGDL